MNALSTSQQFLRFDRNDASMLLGRLDHIHLVAILPDVPSKKSLQGKYFGDDVEQALDWAEKHNNLGWGLYWTLNYVGPGVGTKPSKTDIQAARGAHCDLDPPKDGSVWDKVDKINLLCNYAVPPSLVIDSGNGIQPVWLLERPAKDWKTIESANISIRDAFGGDDCHNIDRLLRLPGSVNYPNNAKKLRGCTPCRASFAVPDTGRRYQPRELLAAFPPSRQVKAKSAPEAQGGTKSTEGELIAAIKRGDNWHNNLLVLTARLIAAGLRTEVILALAEGFTLEGYSVEETLADMRSMIESARKKWERPEPKDLEKHAGEKPRGFRFQAVGKLKLKPPEFVIDTLIETHSLGIMFGDPGAGKSFFAVDASMCVATGCDFHGKTVRQGSVFYIAGEGHNGLVRRFAAWGKHRGIDYTDAPIFLSDRPAQFLDSASARDVGEAVGEMAKLHGAPRLIVVDTLARCFGPGDENSTKDMSAFVAAMDELKAKFPGCTVLVVHHSGHGDKSRARGAVALKGSLDFEYRLDKSETVVRLINTKMKDAPQPPPQAYALKSVEIASGVTSAVLNSVDNSSLANICELTKVQKLSKDTYILAAAQSGIYTDNAFAGLPLEAWRTVFYAKHTGDSADSKRKAFGRAREELRAKGILSVENDVYLWKDPTIAKEIWRLRKGGTSGTFRDI